MSISLDKRIETATVSLQKMAESSAVDLGDVSAQVTAEIDFSGSMDGLYRSGMVQEAVERALALSLTGLDDDGIVPVLFYDTRVYDPIEVSRDGANGTKAYQGVVADFHSNHRMGGTAFSPPIERVLAGGKRKHFGKSPDEKNMPPNLHLFFTDGEPREDDKKKIERLLVQARTRPHFFQFIMLGTDPQAIAYLNHLNKALTGDGVDNVGVTMYNDPANVNDEKFFADIISEFFPIWLPEARKQGVTNK